MVIQRYAVMQVFGVIDEISASVNHISNQSLLRESSMGIGSNWFYLRVRFPELNQLPDEMVEQIQILRETVAGKYALRLYQEDRYVKGM